MRAHALNYLKRDGRDGRRGRLVNVGFWLFNTPRPLIICRLLGHTPVVDGVGDHDEQQQRGHGHVSRWVCCDRCGVRPEPQGNLDPAQWAIGERYTGSFDGRAPDLIETTRFYRERVKELDHYAPGSWSKSPAGELGGQLVIGGGYPGWGFEIKIGNAGSEHTLAASLNFGWLGALYLHTERIGTWWQRRLNPVGYQSRIIGVHIDSKHLTWNLWAKRDERSRDDPWWQHGDLRINVLDRILGPKRYAYEDIGDPVVATVRMPHGDDHDVKLQLQRQAYGRKRLRKRRSWCVDWTTVGSGIPTRNTDRGRIQGSSVAISDLAGRRDHPDPWQHSQWIPEACAAIAVKMTAERTRHGYQARELADA